MAKLTATPMHKALGIEEQRFEALLTLVASNLVAAIKDKSNLTPNMVKAATIKAIAAEPMTATEAMMVGVMVEEGYMYHVNTKNNALVRVVKRF